MNDELIDAFIRELVKKEIQLLRAGNSTADQRRKEVESLANRYFPKIEERK